jgi:hypothetical protein
MRWETILNTAKKKVYELWHKDKYVLSLTYNPSAGTARIESSEEKRLFVISKEGLLRNKTILRNEYGFRVGKLGHENHENFIELEGERFFYIIRKEPTDELVIYKESQEKPIIVCKISPAKATNESMELESGKPIDTTNGASLVMTLCWLLFQPFAKSKVREYSLQPF